MVEVNLAPRRRVMARRAFPAKLAFVRLFFPMTVHALSGCLSVWCVCSMAACAVHACMRVTERKVRCVVVELCRAELDDVGVSAEMLGVTSAAL